MGNLREARGANTSIGHGKRCFAVVLLLLSALPLCAQKVPVVEKHLDNGMRLLLVERHDEPTVAGGWVAHVGSSNERLGMTGIAHLFEHMMFKGTPTIGTKDYQKDLEIIAAQERVRDEMRQQDRKMRAAYRRGEIDDLLKPENKTPRYRELEQEFTKLIADQRAILVKNEFDRIYSGAGGSGMNAFTSEDMTAYFVTVPANKLELWMWMESDRIFHPVFREFYAERDVVFEERRMRTDSTPLGKFQEEFNAMFWSPRPMPGRSSAGPRISRRFPRRRPMISTPRTTRSRILLSSSWATWRLTKPRRWRRNTSSASRAGRRRRRMS